MTTYKARERGQKTAKRPVGRPRKRRVEDESSRRQPASVLWLTRRTCSRLLATTKKVSKAFDATTPLSRNSAWSCGPDITEFTPPK